VTTPGSPSARRRVVIAGGGAAGLEGRSSARGGLEELDAVIFDLDGVITDTAAVHAAAWRRVFDAYLRTRAEREGEPFRPFTDDDYRRHVDGMPRYDGAERFLRSRGIELPRGEASDPPGDQSVSAIANRKDEEFARHLDEQGAVAFGSTLALVERLRERGVRTAVISASRHCAAVLRSAGADGLFEVRVDGLDQERLGFAGKPDPAVFLEAARRLEVEPGRAAVVEDALAGVEAGRRGGFALVVGIDRTGHGEALAAAGADVVVGDLSELAGDRHG
jgi:beta-phosphoglucomutase family hydrolase